MAPAGIESLFGARAAGAIGENYGCNGWVIGMPVASRALQRPWLTSCGVGLPQAMGPIKDFQWENE